jgi:hypothetical protein
MIDTLAQKARWLPAVALLAALLVSSCTAPLPPRRQARAGASGVAGTTETATQAALSPTIAVTTTLQISATRTVAPTPIVTGTVTPSATLLLTSTAVPTTAASTTVPTMAVTIVITAPVTAPPSTSTATRVMPQATIASPVVSETVRAAAVMSPTPTVTEPTATLAPTLIPSATPTPTRRPFVTGALTQTVPPSPTSHIEPTATQASAVTPTTLALAFPTVIPTVIPSATPTAETPAAAALTPLPLQPATYKTGNVLHNGDFEAGFDSTGIGDGWHGFGRVAGVFGWSDETYPTLVFQGQHAQMMRIRTSQYPDAYIGVYQTVPVVKGKPYELDLHGIIRSTEGSPEKSKWGYRLQWGIDPKGGANWQAVTEWVDLGWDEQGISAPSPTMAEYKDSVTPSGNTLTLFIRGWRKWTVPTSEGEFIIGGASLSGPLPVTATAARLPGTGADPTEYQSR